MKFRMSNFRPKMVIPVGFEPFEWFICKSADKNGAPQKKFYIRSGNTSQELDIEDAAAYIKKRF